MNPDESKRGSKRGLSIQSLQQEEATDDDQAALVTSQPPADGLLARFRSSFSMTTTTRPTTTTAADDSMSSLEEFDQGMVLGDAATDVAATNKEHGKASLLLPTTIVAESSSGQSREFELDGVFGPTATQQFVYENSLVDMAKHLFTGYSTTILAYGQTGSGKVGRVDCNGGAFVCRSFSSSHLSCCVGFRFSR